MRASDASFEQWLHAPMDEASPDPRLEVRRARPEDFDAIFDLVDEVFGTKRPRARYDWLYRRNPNGFARCWITVDKETREIVATTSDFPWPTALGEERVYGASAGDAVVARGLQRKRISLLRRAANKRHPLFTREIVFGWPNERSVRRLHGQQRTGRLQGPLPRCVLQLSARKRLAWRGWPRPLAFCVGPVLDAAEAIRQRAGRGLCVEDVARFDERFDSVSKRSMCRDGIWFPRDAEFLNWRYPGHPSQEYRSLALLAGDDDLVAYCVLRLDGRLARLMEFAALDGAETALLAAAGRAARESGCARLEIFATPDWKRWPLFRHAGFVERPSTHYVYLRSHGAEQSRLDEWQLLPGDHDDM